MAGGVVSTSGILAGGRNRRRFDATALPHTDFLTNRTGFVVLHPLKGVAGCPVEILHVDGRKVKDEFPAVVNPVQPFYDIRALSHEVVPGVWAKRSQIDGPRPSSFTAPSI